MGLAVSLFFVVFLVLWFVIRPLSVLVSGWGKREIHLMKTLSSDKLEGVTVIIPCHNEESTITYTVESILSQKLLCDLEVIIVENNSTDNTLGVLEKLSNKYSNVIYDSVVPDKGELPVSTALNHGISMATMPIVVRLDADTQLKDEWSIQKAIEPILEGEAVATACNVRVYNHKKSLLSRLQSIEYFFAMEVDRRSQSLYNSVLCCSGAMQAFRLETIKAVGGYHLRPYISEDMEITFKMHKLGKVLMVEDAISYTDVPLKLGELIKQRYMWMIFGIVCMFVHKRGIGNKKYGVKGLLGLVGLPMKVFISMQALVGIVIKSAVAIVLADKGDYTQMLFNIAWINAVHVAIVWFMMTVVSPVAKDRQGSDQYWLVPVFSIIYQPFLVCVRLWAMIRAILILFRGTGNMRKYSAKIKQDKGVDVGLY